MAGIEQQCTDPNDFNTVVSIMQGNICRSSTMSKNRMYLYIYSLLRHISDFLHRHQSDSLPGHEPEYKKQPRDTEAALCRRSGYRGLG